MNPDTAFFPAVLTVAGSDSGGGAGIQTDLRTFHAYGVFGCSAITAVTSQNPAEVRRIDPLPAEGVAAQMETVLDRIAVRYAKTGMLFSPEIISAAAAVLKARKLPFVCDPVMVSTSGARLLQEQAIRQLIRDVLPIAGWITPNIPEAELLTGRRIADENGAARAARELHDRFHASIVLKGGHGSGKEAEDLICREGKLYRLSAPRLTCPPHAAHGTGCTFSAAMAAGFALGLPWETVLRRAKGFISASLAGAVPIGPEMSGMYPPAAWPDETVRFEEYAER